MGKALDPRKLAANVLGVLTPQVAQRALFAAATPILNQAVDNTPKLEGTLRNSARVVHPGGNPFSVHIVFDTPYAARQHEELGYRHKYGGPKFLERAARSEAETAAQVLATQLRKAFK